MNVSFRELPCHAGRAPVGLEIGTRRIVFQQLQDLARGLPWGHALPEDGSVVVHEIHQDCVLELPKDATLLASSPKTRVEVWAYDSHVLCIQGESPTVRVCVRPESRQCSFFHRVSCSQGCEQDREPRTLIGGI